MSGTDASFAVHDERKLAENDFEGDVQGPAQCIAQRARRHGLLQRDYGQDEVEQVPVLAITASAQTAPTPLELRVGQKLDVMRESPTSSRIVAVMAIDQSKELERSFV